MTNWVTIKIPEETRDKAKEDPRTYEQIMRDGLEESPTVDSIVDVTEVVDQLKDEISMANEPGVSIDEEKIIKRIDDLEAQLPRKVKEELREQ